MRAMMAATLVATGYTRRVDAEDLIEWEDPQEAELRRMGRAFSLEPEIAQPTAHDIERNERAKAKRARKAAKLASSKMKQGLQAGAAE